jgi:geranylgeranyl pyrophosphate synthase
MIHTVKGIKILPKSIGMSNDVWYRKFLKPFIQNNKTASYRDCFQRRVIRTVGIPVTEVHGLHELFEAEYRRYSPLQGMLFAHNNMMDNLYRYGVDDEVAVQLIRELFHVLPGGEIQTTHVGRKTAAHLSSSIVGDLLVAWEEWKRNAEKDDASQDQLVEIFMRILKDHPDFQSTQEELKSHVDKAQDHLKALEKQEEKAASIRDEIKRLEGDVIKVARHQIKRIRKDMKKANEEEQAAMESELSKNEQVIQDTEAEVSKLREHIVTSAEFKAARKALKRAEDAITLEEVDRKNLLSLLANSLFTYDADDAHPKYMPKYSTTAILLAYLWRKYDSIMSLEGYFESMHRLGALSAPMETVKEMLDHVTAPQTSLPTVPRRRMRWNEDDVATAAAVTSGKPGAINRPTVIPFSYITWAAYSEFPDCGETALRNLINQLIFNPDTGKFDYELLQELKGKQYPDMSPKIIDFFKQHNEPHLAAEPEAAVAWIEVVSNLNEGRNDAEPIRYRREKDQKNIASPLRNLLRVFNALFGVEDLNNADVMKDVVENINAIRGFDLDIDLSDVKLDGFGILGLTDGKVRYELQSYKPVHFGFVQVENLKTDRSGRTNFNVLRNLMLQSCKAPVASPDTSAYFEQLALASLFVPYQIQRNKLKRFFRKSPPHYTLLFADLNSESQKASALDFIAENIKVEDSMFLSTLMDNIRSYEVPTFAPPSQANFTDSASE